MTEKIYDIDSHITEFLANVTSCEKSGELFAVTLDRTAFFPEGGGQSSDIGLMNGAEVVDVRIRDDAIVHFVKEAFAVGAPVCCEVDRAHRMHNMQNHTGEHIVSGLVNTIYGYDNVGFHLSSEGATVDFNGILGKEDIDKIELLANEAVTKNIAVTAEYPSPEELSRMVYRSKLDLDHDVRIVTIGGYDRCACCAPHVKRTGEIGVIKLIDFAKYKGGTRIFMVCGLAALRDYRNLCDTATELSALTSAKRNELVPAIERIMLERDEALAKLSVARRELSRVTAENTAPTGKNICAFFPDFSIKDLREAANLLVPKCDGVCAVLSAASDGFLYVAASSKVDMRRAAKEINEALTGRGGGSVEMISGSVHASEREIKDFFDAKTFD